MTTRELFEQLQSRSLPLSTLQDAVTHMQAVKDVLQAIQQELTLQQMQEADAQVDTIIEQLAILNRGSLDYIDQALQASLRSLSNLKRFSVDVGQRLTMLDRVQEG